jgi:hypothetical protein
MKDLKNPPMFSRLMFHFAMGVALGLVVTIVLLTSNGGMITDMIRSSTEAFIEFTVAVSVGIGAGATLTGLAFETEREETGDSY